MLLRIFLLLVLTGGLAGAGAVAWVATRARPLPPVQAALPAQVATSLASAPILAAARTLRPGALIKPDDLSQILLPQSAVPSGATADTPADRADLVGAMIRKTAPAGEPLLPAHLIRPGDRGFLASVLSPGMRAAAVGVDPVSGAANLIWPGDRVDLILTETIDDPGAPLGRRIAGETVLEEARVIAIDQDLTQGAAAAPPASGPGTQQGRTVTLEVSPADAARVAVAARLGRLSLSLISASPPAAPSVPSADDAAAARGARVVVWGGDVSAALRSGRKQAGSSNTLRLFEGGAEGKEFQFR